MTQLLVLQKYYALGTALMDQHLEYILKIWFLFSFARNIYFFLRSTMRFNVTEGSPIGAELKKLRGLMS